MKQEKKIYRSSSNFVISGVCGGIAEYFGIDVNIVRIIFIVFALAGGGGLIIYIIS
jgi:phage shock protein PspC (stress-responsive transcriptional regulator)